jgi:Holliday junction DNA helicase RuvB
MEILIIFLVAVLVGINAYIKTMANDSSQDKPVFANKRLKSMEPGENRIRRFLGEEHLPVSINDDSIDWINQKKIDWQRGIDGYGNPRTDSEWLKAQGNDITRVIIQPNKLDLSKIGGGNAVEVQKFECRPQTWGQFKGQKNAKAQAPIIVEFFKRGMPAHVLLTGLQGHGKTSYIELLAKSMGAHLIQRIGNTVTLETLPEIINEINASTDPCIFFCDELDTMDSEIIKLLNPIVESFKISGKLINPFIFAGATINLDRITQRNSDFLDRIPFKIQFVRYTIDELKTIAKQVHDQLYKEAIINDEQLTRLAQNCKLNPRSIIHLLRYLVVDGDVDHVLKVNEIIKDGLTITDVKILEYLASCKRAIGANSIALKVSMRQRQYEVSFEPYLFEQGLILRTPQRMISDKGKEFLRSIGTA